MRSHAHPLVLLALSALVAPGLSACGGAGSQGQQAASSADAAAAALPEALPEALPALAVSEGAALAERAIEALRGRGPEGHAALMEAHAEAIEALRSTPLLAADAAGDAAVARLRHAIDRVSGQRDGHASGLYWHTDMESAQAEARRTGRPILSLRLLGRLDEELSCANSRFFRVVLYSDPEVAAYLASHFVLHWSSERPAPRITIDMGDGRRIVRTVTGNSVHYLLDAEGRPIDAIVGLYAPRPFLEALGAAEGIHQGCAGRPEPARGNCVAELHRRASVGARLRWATLPEQLGGPSAMERALASLPPLALRTPEAPVPAAVAMPLTVAKAAVEQPMLDMMQVGAQAPYGPRPPEPDWGALGAALHGAQPGMSERGQALLRLKLRRAGVEEVAGRLSGTALADGVRNELLFRRVIHLWFAEQQAGMSTLAVLNARVYAELMGTPADDPWLGLRSDPLYDAVDVEAGGAPSAP